MIGSIDASGRLSIPAACRRRLGLVPGTPLIVTRPLTDPSLVLQSEASWQALTDAMRVTLGDATFADVLAAAARRVRVDSRGRVPLPPALRAHAGLDRRCVVDVDGTNLRLKAPPAPAPSTDRRRS